MYHAVFFSYFISMLSGWVVTALLYLLYRRFRTRKLRDYFTLFLSVSILVLVHTVNIYIQVIHETPRLYPGRSLMVLTSICEIGVAMSAWRLYNTLVNLDWNHWKLITACTAGTGILLLPLFPFDPGLLSDMRDIVVLILFGMMGYGYFRRRRKSGWKDAGIYARFYLVLLAITVPVILSAIVLKHLPVFHRSVPQSAFSLSVLFFCFNCLTIVLIYRSHSRFAEVDPQKGGFREMQSAYKLTPREIEILQLVGDGCSNPEIADRLFIASRTVRNHLYNIFQKTGVKTRYELIAMINRSI